MCCPGSRRCRTGAIRLILTVTDSDGNMVSLIQSNYAEFGRAWWRMELVLRCRIAEGFSAWTRIRRISLPVISGLCIRSFRAL